MSASEMHAKCRDDALRECQLPTERINRAFRATHAPYNSCTLHG